MLFREGAVFRYIVAYQLFFDRTWDFLILKSVVKPWKIEELIIRYFSLISLIEFKILAVSMLIRLLQPSVII